MIAYAHALQYWVEKSDLPTGGQPHQLDESVKELWEEMKCYLSFSDREVFEGVTPLEGMSSSPVEGAKPTSMMTVPATTSQEQAVKETPQKPVKERKCPKFLRWEKCCNHASLLWLQGSSLACQKAQSSLIHLWPIATSLQI